MALSRRFIEGVLQNAEFGKRILSVVVDEAHVVSHWGTQFRKKYGTLGTIRAHLPRGTLSNSSQSYTDRCVQQASIWQRVRQL